MQYFATVTGNKDVSLSREVLTNFLLDYCAEKYGEAEATAHTMVLMQELQNGTIKLWRNNRSTSITITGKE
jgi:hypothetical protein